MDKMPAQRPRECPFPIVSPSVSDMQEGESKNSLKRCLQECETEQNERKNNAMKIEEDFHEQGDGRESISSAN